MQTNQVSKSNLAKLLATENINVVYRKTDTASFNVENRTLTLPLLNDMTADMQDLFIGHEVGHAIDTPATWSDGQKNMPKGFKTFLNVVEDARIERRIKDRYPGLKKSFNLGYKEFANRDFFQVKNKDVNRMLLIDRINLYFKIGPFFQVNFNSQEQALVKKVAACNTFDDVIAVSKELYDYCKDELEQKRQEAFEEFKQKLADGEFDDDFDGFDDGELDDNYDDGSEFDPDSFDAGDNEFLDEEKETSYSHSKRDPQFEDHQPEELKDYDEVKSSTDENLDKALRNMAEQKEIYTGSLESCATNVKYDKVIVPYKNILDKIFFNKGSEDYKSDLLIEFEKKNKNSVSYLVKEFEMKKRAAELRRMIVSDTGVIDTNKLHTYKFNDNIFRKIGSIPAGKNHGIVMFLDWSGSMGDNMSGTIEQLITLTTFCRKVNVPFEVYAFSTEYKNLSRPIKNVEGSIGFEDAFVLLNLFSSRMKNQEYRRMANDLLNYGKICNQYYSRVNCEMNPDMGLGGTPLNATIYIASEIVKKFQKSHKAEIVDVVFLTDGEDSTNLFVKSEQYYNSFRIGPPTRNSVAYIQDKETQKRYRIGENGVTPVLLKILKDRTGCNLIGFYILPGTKRHFFNAMNRFGKFVPSDDFKMFKTEKYYSIADYGYDQYFLIPGGKDLSIEDEDLDDILPEKDVSVRKLKGAFLKMNQNRLTNRVLLSKVIDEIA